MIVSWIVITLLIAVVLGVIGAFTIGQEFDSPVFGFIWAAWTTVCISGGIAAIYVAAHFIGKYW